ncbi:MAG: hypothetical protein OEU92_30525 [Alphaproteobacteria bacterium]|nr:hypothetical protein [Alphaproteobacteria bacterium]
MFIKTSIYARSGLLGLVELDLEGGPLFASHGFAFSGVQKIERRITADGAILGLEIADRFDEVGDMGIPIEHDRLEDGADPVL